MSGHRNGVQRLVAQIGLGLVQDLATLRRGGAWKDDLAELAEFVAVRNGAQLSRLPTAVRAAYQAGMEREENLERVARLLRACGLEVTRQQLVEAAKRAGGDGAGRIVGRRRSSQCDLLS